MIEAFGKEEFHSIKAKLEDIIKKIESLSSEESNLSTLLASLD